MKNESLSLRFFLEIEEIISFHLGKSDAVILRGKWFEEDRRSPLTGRKTYKKSVTSTWQFAESVVQQVLVHHACSDCQVFRRCVHRSCKESCSQSTYEVKHTTSELWAIDSSFHTLCS